MHYFVRVNGDTKHNNPAVPHAYVPGELPRWPQTFFSSVDYCLRHNIIRIGWPDTGNLLERPKSGALANLYSLSDLKPRVQGYLNEFVAIQPGSTVLMPDKLHPGDLFIGTVTEPYSYFHDVPVHPYECAHRVGVKWDAHADGSPIRYGAGQLNIGIKGGFWAYGFQVLDTIPTGVAAIPVIERERRKFASGEGKE